MCAKKVYVIAGGNRGIGLGIAKFLSQDSDNIVIATARNPDKATELIDLQSKKSNVHSVKLDVISAESAQAAAEEVKKITGGVVDVLIENAGVGYSYTKVLETTPKEYEDHWRTNVLGVVNVFQAFYPLMKTSSIKQIAFISSMAGSVGGYFSSTVSAYGMTKAALNYLTRSIASDLKEEGFTVVSIHPGLVETDMGKYAIEVGKLDLSALNLEALTPEKSGEYIVKTIQGLTQEKTDSFLNYDGTSLTW